jgi:hypothetical protein
MITLLLALLTSSACVKEQVVVPTRTDTGIGPALVIERFMRAVNSEPKDLLTMGSLFGTRDGPISERDPRAQVEQRMFAIATVLHHDDYEIVREQQVPGRTQEATQLLVRIKAGAKEHTVPFTMVRYKDGAWLIEQIGIDVITNTR